MDIFKGMVLDKTGFFQLFFSEPVFPKEPCFTLNTEICKFRLLIRCLRHTYINMYIYMYKCSTHRDRHIALVYFTLSLYNEFIFVFSVEATKRIRIRYCFVISLIRIRCFLPYFSVKILTIKLFK